MSPMPSPTQRGAPPAFVEARILDANENQIPFLVGIDMEYKKPFTIMHPREALYANMPSTGQEKVEEKVEEGADE